MRTILVIGIGAGNPDYLTVQAINAMNRAEVFFMPDKGEEKAGLNAIRLQMLEKFVAQPRYRLVDFAIPSRRQAETSGYRDAVQEWRDKLAAAYQRMFAELGEDGVGAFLVWGDPTLYDGTLRILKDMQAADWDFTIEVIPGISAPQALHRVAPALVQALKAFEREGFAAFSTAYAARDLLAGQPIVTTAPELPGGLAEGVGPDGALRVRVGGELRSLTSGEVSVRLRS